MTDLTLSMPPALRLWVDHRVAEGRYADADDYLRDLVRRDQEVADDDRGWLRGMIEEGLESGVVDADPDELIEAIIARAPAANA